MKDKELIKLWRVGLGLNQTQAAHKLGLKSRQSIWQYENAKRAVPSTIKHLIKYIK